MMRELNTDEIVAYLEQEAGASKYLREINHGAPASEVFAEWQFDNGLDGLEMRMLDDGTRVTYCAPHGRWEWDCKDCHAVNTSRDIVCHDCFSIRSERIKAQHAKELADGSFWKRFE